MDTVIDTLYVYSRDNRSFSDSEAYCRHSQIFNYNKEKLLISLQGEEKKQLLALIEAVEELEWITVKTEFQEGLKVGIELYSELSRVK